MNDLVRQLAARHKVALADVHKDFLKQPNLSALFSDSVHPNDAGYKVMSRSFFDAITKPVGDDEQLAPAGLRLQLLIFTAAAAAAAPGPRPRRPQGVRSVSLPCTASASRLSASPAGV